MNISPEAQLTIIFTLLTIVTKLIDNVNARGRAEVERDQLDAQDRARMTSLVEQMGRMLSDTLTAQGRHFAGLAESIKSGMDDMMSGMESGLKKAVSGMHERVEHTDATLDGLPASTAAAIQPLLDEVVVKMGNNNKPVLDQLAEVAQQVTELDTRCDALATALEAVQELQRQATEKLMHIVSSLEPKEGADGSLEHD